MKWNSETLHHPLCNFWGAPRKGCKMCERFYRDYPVYDTEVEEPPDLVKKYFPGVAVRK